MLPAPMARAICSAKALTAEFEPCEQTICNGLFNVGSRVVQKDVASLPVRTHFAPSPSDASLVARPARRQKRR